MRPYEVVLKREASWSVRNCGRKRCFDNFCLLRLELMRLAHENLFDYTSTAVRLEKAAFHCGVKDPCWWDVAHENLFDYRLTAVGLEKAAFRCGVKARLHKTVGIVLAQLFKGPAFSANPGVKSAFGFLFVCLKAFSSIIVSILFRASNH